jgi:hypothetical protein
MDHTPFFEEFHERGLIEASMMNAVLTQILISCCRFGQILEINIFLSILTNP